MPPPARDPNLPPLFQRLMVLDSRVHGELRLDRTPGFAHAAATNALPLGLSEVASAAAHYPIVFAVQGEPSVAAVLGYRDGENLFVDERGAWRQSSYVPAYARAYPFAAIQVSADGQIALAIDPDAQCIAGGTGEPLFTYGRPTKLAQDQLAFARSLREELKRARDFAQGLVEAQVLVAHDAMMEFANGTKARLSGLSVVDPAKVDALPDTKIIEWRLRGWLAPLYAHLVSMGHWGRIIDLGAQRMAAAAAAALSA